VAIGYYTGKQDDWLPKPILLYSWYLNTIACLIDLPEQVFDLLAIT
jgi:hypothetical protein